MTKKAGSPEAVSRLEHDIEETRERLSKLVEEVDRRRHEILSPRAHPVAAVIVGAAAAAAVLGIVVAVKAWRMRPHRRRLQRPRLG